MYTFSDLQKYLDTIPVREKVPGLDLKVLHKGREVFRYQCGYKDRENKIPMKGDVNSLNASVAAALFIYEAVRQNS